MATAAPTSAVHHRAASVPAAHAKKLIGTFRIKAGKASGSTVTGSYFRMLTPGNSGYFHNSNSNVRHGSYTLLKPGTAKGLTTGKYQRQPSPAFGPNGGSLAAAIIQPTLFESVAFSVSTNRTDPQTGIRVPVPTIRVRGNKLRGNLSAFAASWNHQNFNQGSPKPNGTFPGHTTRVTGTYNHTTHRYTLNWRSQIVGGPFAGFTGEWHFTGTFHAA
jgi:hypothetical protein